MPENKEDTRYCYGANCTWHGPIQKVGTYSREGSKHKIPCCPHCGGMLFEKESKELWDKDISEFVKRNPEFSRYAEYIQYLGEKKCESFNHFNFVKDYKKYIEEHPKEVS